jgi:hypothetical protein
LPINSSSRSGGNYLSYNRENAVNYALKWAFSRNPQFYDYSALGGDCTSFASQVLLAGGSIMNYDPVSGWYYLNSNQKSPSWTGVNFLFNFLVTTSIHGPFAEQVDPKEIEIGDLIQLSFQDSQNFNHSLIVTEVKPPLVPAHIYVSTHSDNQMNVSLSRTYTWVQIRFLHIIGSK